MKAILIFLFSISITSISAQIKDKSLSLYGNNPVSSANNFYNKIEFTGLENGALVFKPGSSKELMFGMHNNGHFYWGTGKSATKPNFYSMALNANTGELQPRSIRLTGGTVVNGWRQTNFHWAGHSLIFGTKKGTHAHNVIELKPGGADQGQLLAAFKMHHAISKTEHDQRVNIDTRTNSPTYFDVGNIGIGTRTPERKLDVISPNDHIARFRVNDALGDYFQIQNSTSLANQFIPVLRGHHESDNRYSFTILGSTIESMDNGSNAVVNFDARRINGPIENRPLFNWTSYKTKMMTMDAKGNLGIGVTVPTAKLDVNGITKSKSISISGSNPVSSANNFYNKIEFTGLENGALVFKPGSSKELMFGMHDNGHFYWGTGKSATKPNFYPMALNANTGELQPRSIRLTGGTVVNGWRQTNFHWAGHSLIFGTKKGTHAHNVIELKPGGADQGQLFAAFKMHHAISKTEHDQRVNIDTRTNSPTYFDAGNVGIGIRDPQNKLSVNGTIWAKEVKISLNDAADYVFEDDYNLKPLSEVENYIKENKHLPEIPSAEDFRKNDLKVSEMTNKLLQKIEELTLYTIEQEKQLKNKTNEISDLKGKNVELINKLDNFEARLEKLEQLQTK